MTSSWCDGRRSVRSIAPTPGIPAPYWDGDVLEFRFDGRPLLMSNMRLNRFELARRRRIVKAEAALYARSFRSWHGGIVLGPCHVETVGYQGARGRAVDPGALAPFTKAVLDGFVSAGLLPDDSGRFVLGEQYLPPVREGATWSGVAVRLRLAKGST